MTPTTREDQLAYLDALVDALGRQPKLYQDDNAGALSFTTAQGFCLCTPGADQYLHGQPWPADNNVQINLEFYTEASDMPIMTGVLPFVLTFNQEADIAAYMAAMKNFLAQAI